ncbi:hypothetical protein DSO57_1015084 [Entomophthora muscae]|uniref:Uncharacterized protein n=1 Tax=Entomophthora muscae TaxID=34485 RepID=A0ACC2T5L5_9FUNG|nr:hypothetical protein DSO57_1015084 [Entomophthora muscae]
MKAHTVIVRFPMPILRSGVVVPYGGYENREDLAGYKSLTDLNPALPPPTKLYRSDPDTGNLAAFPVRTQRHRGCSTLTVHVPTGYLPHLQNGFVSNLYDTSENVRAFLSGPYTHNP